jgi:hypothetical protein
VKIVKCNYFGCANRKRNLNSDKNRTAQDVETPDDFDGPAYCSVECAVYDGAITDVPSEPPPQSPLQQ